MDRLGYYPWQRMLEEERNGNHSDPYRRPAPKGLVERFINATLTPLTLMIGDVIDNAQTKQEMTTPREFFGPSEDIEEHDDGAHIGSVFGKAIVGNNLTIKRAVGCHIEGDANRIEMAIRCSVHGRGTIVDNADAHTRVSGMGSFIIAEV